MVTPVIVINRYVTNTGIGARRTVQTATQAKKASIEKSRKHSPVRVERITRGSL